MEITKEIKQKMESRLQELAAKQGGFFKQKKADRDTAALATVREELNKLKAAAQKVYRSKALSEEDEQLINSL